MSETAAHENRSLRAPAPVAQGATWFAGMVWVWSAFVTLLAASPSTLEDVYDWLTGLAIVWEILMWIVLLPWALAYVAWESSWDHWLRVVIVVAVATVHLVVSAPRAWR